MDNYKTPKKKPKKAAGIDGFVNGRDTLRRRQIGNFNQPDGFMPKPQRSIGFKSDHAATGRLPLRDKQGNILLSDQPLDRPHQKRHIPWRKIAKRSSMALVALLIVGGSYMVTNSYLKARKVFGGGGGAAGLEANVDPTKLKGEGDGRVNILLLGKGGIGHDGADLTDTILLASVDPVHHDAALVSIPRDTWVKTSSGSMKINAVYATAKNKVLAGRRIPDQAQKAEEAGFNAIEEEIKDVLGIPIHYHAMVDFTGFKEAIDAVGGVDVAAPSSVYEVMSIDGKRYTLNVKTGLQHFDGFRALAYSRSRHTSSRGDFDRAERQRLILIALKQKIFSLGTLSNPVKINELTNAFGDHISTNLSIDELLRLYDIGKQIDGSKVESIGLADPPNNFLITSNISGLSVVVPKAGTFDYSAIQNYIRNKLRDPYLRDENASIAVYNGTSITGLAGKTATDLRSYGYNITTVDDAPVKGNSDTILVDLRKGQKKYTLNYLEKRLDVKAQTSMPAGSGIDPGTADFVIILGTNEQSRLQQ